MTSIWARTDCLPRHYGDVGITDFLALLANWGLCP